ncbi:MAG: hypothetical protein ABI763_01440, partial [Bacteroidota bacterium]
MRRGRKIIAYSIAGLLLFILLYLLFRNYILHTVINKISEKLDKDYHLELTIGESGFSGLATVEMKQISIAPYGGDTLFHMDTLSAAPSISSLLFLNIRLQSLEMKRGFIHLTCSDSSCNYSSLLSKKSDTVSADDHRRNYAALFYRFFAKVFDFAPQNAVMCDLNLSFKTDTFQTNLRIPEFYSSVEKMEGELEDVIQHERWKMTGTFNQEKRKYDMVIYPMTGHSRLPLLKELFNTTADFDTAHVALIESDYSNSIFRMSGNLSASGLSLYQKKISDDTVKIENGSFNYNVTITANSIALDSSSSMMLNKINIHPFFKVTAGEGKTFELLLRTDSTQATDFFSSLPAGVFDETKDIQADGQLQYALRFKLDSTQPDS